jgi:hypothetical protein
MWYLLCLLVALAIDGLSYLVGSSRLLGERLDTLNIVAVVGLIADHFLSVKMTVMDLL